MRRESNPHREYAPIPARTAWWIACLTTLVAVLALGAAHSAQAKALTVPGATARLPIDDPADESPEADDEGAEEEGDAQELESCEVFEEDGEEEEICEEEESEDEVPAACLLSSATATVSANAAQGRVRLAIRYTTSTPAAVNVDYFLRGRKGPLDFADQRKRFGKTGVFRASVELTEAQMKKVLAAKSFRVQVHALNAPHYCDRYFERNLTERRAVGKGLTWSDPAASSRERG
jgi:hypothetical protein